MKSHTYPPATLVRRLSAALYDGLLLIALWIGATAVAVLVNAGQAIDSGHPLLQAWLLAIPVAFYLWFWTHGGQTLGMRAWRLRLISQNGQAITPARALLRMPLAMLAWLSVIGLLWCLVDPRGRAAHDLLSGCLVIVEPKSKLT